MREMRAALYARVSCTTPRTKQAMGSQLEALRDHAPRSGMKIIGEFTDEGSSGWRLDRPGLKRVRDLAQQRGFDGCGAVARIGWHGMRRCSFSSSKSWNGTESVPRFRTPLTTRSESSTA